MPRKPSNFTRLHRMSKAELASELKRIYESESLPYMNFAEWLGSDNSDIIPSGKKIKAEVIIRERHSRLVVDRVNIECIIISDNKVLFNSRYYLIYDYTDGKIKSIPFDSLEIIGW